MRARLAIAVAGTLAGGGAAGAQPAQPDEVIVMTYLRSPRPMRDVPSTVTVVSREEITRGPRRGADDLVRTVPSAATFRRSSSLVADPTSQGLNLRGVGPSGVSRTLVLRDGVPLNDPFGGWIYWRAVPLLDIEQVEIAPGGTASQPGGAALGGVVQLSPRAIDGRSLEAFASGGSFATARAGARATDRFGGVAASVDLDALDSGGYAPIAPGQRGAVDGPAASAHLGGGARVETRPTAGALVRGSARLFRQTLDAGTEHTSADVLAGTYAVGLVLERDAGTLRADAFGGHQRLRQERARVNEDRSAAERASRQRVPSNDQGIALGWTTTPLGALGSEHVVATGIDGRRVAGTSREELSPAVVEPGSIVERVAGGEQRFAGAFVEDIVRVPGWFDLTAAVRLDVWGTLDGRRTLAPQDGAAMVTTFDDTREVEVSPRLGLLRRAGDHVVVRASGYRSFRAPTLNELYRPFQVGTVLTESNPTLRAETLWGAEAGVELLVSALVARATVFWNELDDPVNNVTLAAPLPSGATRQRQNLGHARVRGGELEGGWRPAVGWMALVGYTFVDPVVTRAPGHPELVGNDLPQDPRHRLTASLGFDDPTIAAVTVQGRVIGRQFEDDRNERAMGRFVLVDVTASRRLGLGLSLFASVENLADRRYLVGRAGIDTVGQPRSVQVGVAFDSAAVD